LTDRHRGQARLAVPGRRLILALLTLLLLVVPACGADDAEELADRAREEARQRSDEIREDLEARADRLRRRIEEALGDLERAVPRAERTSPKVQARGRTGTTTIDAFLTDVITSVDTYWTRTMRASGLPEPRVRYVWVPPGGRRLTRCGAVAGDDAAFYCPADDTIYVAQRFATDLYNGVIRGLPGERSGGRAAGDFGVAYVVAHEYAHNLQHELGLFSLGRGNSSKPIELQADCMAGSWGNSVYAEGGLEPGDVEEAVSTALAVGDFDVSGRNHHGTPQERRDAWLTGFRSGDPSVCSRFAPS
jgi:predicted metalloprotease